MQPPLPDGYRLAHFETLGSTNEEALRRAGDKSAQDLPQDRLWIVARTQTQGRGREGRPWIGSSGNLYASLLLQDPAPLTHIPQLGFVAAVALAETVRLFLHESACQKLALKWPNDLLYESAKLSGILVETRPHPETSTCSVVIGWGVNCQTYPMDLSLQATSLAQMGIPYGPIEIFSQLAARMAHWLTVWQKGAAFEPVRQAWLSYGPKPGQWLQASNRLQHIEGQFVTLDPQGCLVIRTRTRFYTISVGDITLMRAPL